MRSCDDVDASKRRLLPRERDRAEVLHRGAARRHALRRQIQSSNARPHVGRQVSAGVARHRHGRRGERPRGQSDSVEDVRRRGPLLVHLADARRARRLHPVEHVGVVRRRQHARAPQLRDWRARGRLWRGRRQGKTHRAAAQGQAAARPGGADQQGAELPESELALFWGAFFVCF